MTDNSNSTNWTLEFKVPDVNSTRKHLRRHPFLGIHHPTNLVSHKNNAWLRMKQNSKNVDVLVQFCSEIFGQQTTYTEFVAKLELILKTPGLPQAGEEVYKSN
ncbi:hypothetical protein Ddc_24090 [Ditylenchus destructor]|nr:hypothetical protein Ddc_24090 [Ditylenchus destructor]